MQVIRTADVRGGVYVGRAPDQDSVMVVPMEIGSLTFPHEFTAKAIMSGRRVRLAFLGSARIRHVKLGGSALFLQNLFCGSIEAEGVVRVRGDLVSWLGDLVSAEGSFVVGGEIRSAGSVMARNGAIVAGSISAEGRVFSLNTWRAGVDGPQLGIAALAAAEAVSFERSFGELVPAA